MIYRCIGELPVKYKTAIVEAVNLIIKRDISGLEQIVLFGSCARLHLHVGSDIDLLIVTKEVVRDRRLLGFLRTELEFLSDEMMGDIVFTTKKKLEISHEKLYVDIRRDGITLWDGGKFTDEYKQLLPASKE